MLKHDPGRVTISVVIPLHPIPLCSRYKMGNLSGGSTASLGQPQFYDFKKNLHKKGSRSSASALKSNLYAAHGAGWWRCLIPSYVVCPSTQVTSGRSGRVNQAGLTLLA
jgi:hypothetical protein